MADLVPQRIRGKYFAGRSRYGIATMIVTSLALGAAMDWANTQSFLHTFSGVIAWSGMPPLILLLSVVFIVGGLIGILDILAFIRVDEPPMKRSSEPLLAKLGKPLGDRQFMIYCAYWSIWTFANSFGGTLWWLNVLEFFDKLAAGEHAGKFQWWTDHRWLMCFISLPIGYQIGQFLGFPIWGRAVDRFGRKPVMFVSSTLHTISWVCWIFLSPTMLPWMPFIQIAGGIVGAGQDIGGFNMMLQFNRKGGSGYQALGSVLFAIAGAIAALLCGGLLESLRGFTAVLWEGTSWQYTVDRFTVLILVAVAIKYLGDLVILPYVHDVAARPRRETVRFVFSNMYGTINALVFAPVAAGIGATGRTLGHVKNKVTDAAEVAGANFKKWFR
jgi:MFS family permease